MKKRSVDLICDVAELISLSEARYGWKKLLKEVASIVAQYMQVDVCSIYTYNEDERMLTLRATHGLDRHAVGRVRLKLGEGITGLAVQESRSICVENASKHLAYKFFPGICEEQFEVFLAVPILRGLQQQIGALVVQKKEKNCFTPNDIKVLLAIAAQLSTTIENVQLLTGTWEEVEHEIPPAPKQETVEHPIRGRSASTGTARGRACTLDSIHGEIVVPSDTDARPPTTEDFYRAVEKTTEQIDHLQRQTSEKLADVAVLIFNAHLLILEDEQFTGRISHLIHSGMEAVNAIATVVNEYVKAFSESKMPIIHEKILDVKDLGHRLTLNVLNKKTNACDYRGQIVVAHELLPSEMLKLATENAEGFIVSSGFSTHNAIIARSLEIPMVAIDREQAEKIPEGEDILMDAEQGIIYLRPGVEVHEKYRALDKAWQALHNASDMQEQSLTQCGEQVHIYANINLLSDLGPAREFKAEGVGLYRSEFPFIVRNNFPAEEEQYTIYKKIVDQMEGKPVTFRTLDIGGDKMLSYYAHVNEANPFLGMRAIRFSLKNKDIFCQQLRALLRAGTGGNTRIIFPLVSSVDDFTTARTIVHECMDRLETEGVPFNRETQLGAMMESPSAVEVAEELAQEADFLSIGSNDLIQYMLAVDRTNERVSDLYLAHHPAILRAINRIVSACRKHKKEVSICGDLATNQRLFPFLLGIGLRRFSIDIIHAPAVQRLISCTTIDEAHQTAARLLHFGRIDEIEAFLSQQIPVA